MLHASFWTACCAAWASRSLKPRQHSSVGDATYPFVLRNSLCHPRQALVICPVHPAELGYGVAYSETCRVRRAALHHAVDLREGRLQGCGRWAERCLCLAGRGRVVCLLCQARVVLVEALLDARHEVLVVILQAYDARARRSYCGSQQRLTAGGACAYSGQRRCHSAGNRRRWSGRYSCGRHATTGHEPAIAQKITACVPNPAPALGP
jgi:hypothetical protein